MKIGIITFHRANNYGAVLQCYALQQVLLSLGHEVFVLDYRQPYVELVYNPVRFDVIREGLTKPRLLMGYCFKVFPERFKRMRAYDKFRSKYIKCTPLFHVKEQMPQDFDVYVIGSDQLWNVALTGQVAEELYYGVFPHKTTSKIVGYAISADVASIDFLGVEKLKSYLRNFETISFREKTIRDYVEAKTGIRGRVDIDPTLLLDKSSWEDLFKKPLLEGKYVLTYFLPEDMKKTVELFAKDRGCKVVDMYDIALTPDDFLTAIYNADFVLTLSFHAVVFSILFHKNFYAINGHNGREVRYVNLLEKIGIEDRLIDIQELMGKKDNWVNYNDVDEKIATMRQNSWDYLCAL